MNTLPIYRAFSNINQIYIIFCRRYIKMFRILLIKHFKFEEYTVYLHRKFHIILWNTQAIGAVYVHT